MKKYILLILTVFISVNYSQVCKSKIIIETTDSASLIFINDIFVAHGNIEKEIELGDHLISIRESLTKWSGYNISDTINISDCGKTYILNYDIQKNILVNTLPQNAEIIYKDSTIGHTPQFVNSKYLEEIKFKKGSSIIAADYISLKNNIAQKIDFEPVHASTSFTDSDLFKVLIGSAIVLGGTAAYFKIQADKKYDDYLISKDKSALNEIDKLDLYSGISLGLLQINIGYLIYRFLTD